MEYKYIQCEELYDGSVLKIVLNTPKANVLEAAMLHEIAAVIDTMEEKKELKLLIFEGAGKHFSFGASVPEHTKEQAPMMLSAFHGMFYALVKSAIPTMAVVRGQCLGGGMELALYCNFIVAEKTAAFGQPEIVLGVLPPPASVMLCQKVSQGLADDLILTGRSIDGAEAYRVGLVNLLADEGQDAWDAASKWIEKHIVPKSASSLRFANRTSRMEFFRRIEEDLPEVERIYLEELMATHDANEGIAAFMEKRKPDWKSE